MGKHFIDGQDKIVEDAIEGLLCHSSNLARLDGFEQGIRVVVYKDWDRERDGKSQVALISGGGSGHEPAHCGLVGQGLLTAAVCGDVFASPSVTAVLSAIQAVCGEAGALLIVKNYTGDRLNFGLAAEQARAMGLAVAMVIVADDVALGANRTRARGIAGTAFVHKVAGHAAASRRPLADVARAAQTAADTVVSIGSALQTCTLYGQPHNTRLDDERIFELGLGIHGEPGVEQRPLQPIKLILEQMVGMLVGALAAGNESKPAALLVNNLGSVPQLEMSIIAGRAVECLRARHIDVQLMAVGAVVTSLDMKGFSLSLVALDTETPDALLRPTDAVGWAPLLPVSRQPSRAVVPCPELRGVSLHTRVWHAALQERCREGGCLLYGVRPNPDTCSMDGTIGAQALGALRVAMEALVRSEAQLNAWDAEVGDGDAGTSFAKGAARVLADCASYPGGPAQLCGALAYSLGRSMGGTSGVLMRIGLLAAARELANQGGVGGEAAVLLALRTGTRAIMQHGGAEVGHRTMVDALAPAATAPSLAEAARLARAGAEGTRRMPHAQAGRSAYIAHDLSAPDPGAIAMATLLEALAAHGAGVA